MQNNKVNESYWIMLLRRFRRILYFVDNVLPKHEFNGYILDVGCGRTGWLSLVVKSYFNGYVVTSDVYKDSVRDAKKIADPLKLESDGYIVADASHMPIKDAVFDKVVGGAILHHLLDKIDSVACEFYRITKEDGGGVFSGEIVASRSIGWMWKKLILEKAPLIGGSAEGIATKTYWVETFRKAGFSKINVAREVLYGYITNSIYKIIYYRLIKFIPKEFTVAHLITSATITMQK